MIAQKLDQMHINQKKIEERLATSTQAPHPHLTQPNFPQRENLHNLNTTPADYSEVAHDSLGNYNYPDLNPTQNISAIQEPFKNSSNWKNYPNYSWNNQVSSQPYHFNGYGSNPNFHPGPSQQDINAQMLRTLQDMQTKMTEVTRNITNLNNQIGVAPTQRPVGHLPSQPIPNPNHQGNHYPNQPPPNPPQQPPRFLQSQAPPPPPNNNPTAHAVTLRSGKTTTDPEPSHEPGKIHVQVDSPPPHQEEKEQQKSQDKIPVPFPQALYPTTNKKKKSEPTT
jgi:hypothetical protein